jgi:hypothetical protein
MVLDTIRTPVSLARNVGMRRPQFLSSVEPTRKGRPAPCFCSQLDHRTRKNRADIDDDADHRLTAQHAQNSDT